MRLVPPFRGEFGLKLCYHVPAVYALEPPYAVAIEEGDEALYPGAVDYVRLPRYNDDERAGGKHWRMGAEWAREHGYADIVELTPESPKRRFVPEPSELQDVPTADVVICPRMRRYGAEKNWPHWGRLADMLDYESVEMFAAGAPDSSEDVGIHCAWVHPRFLDASIQAIRAAKLVIATDAGLAHLALLCGAPLLLLTCNGKPGPGAITNSRGAVMEPVYFDVKWHRYRDGNHTGSPFIHEPRAWDDPACVAARALDFLSAKEAA